MRTIVSILAAIAFASLPCWPRQAAAANFPIPEATPFSTYELLHGKLTTKAECLTIDTTVWVTVDGSSECLRYYMSRGDMAAAATQHEAAVLFHGDLVASAVGEPPVAAPLYNTFSPAMETGEAIALGGVLGVPTLVLARPGSLGSSGNEMVVRHTVHEARLVNAALGAIARKYQITKLHLIGQSGGSILIGALLAMRNDIGCAAMGSGWLALEPFAYRPVRLDDLNGRAWLDDQQYVASIRPTPDLRVVVIGDPADTIHAPIRTQTTFAARAAAAGVPVLQLMTLADPDGDFQHHDVSVQTQLAAKACIAKATNAEIAAVVRSVTEANRQKLANLARTILPIRSRTGTR